MKIVQRCGKPWIPRGLLLRVDPANEREFTHRQRTSETKKVMFGPGKKHSRPPNIALPALYIRTAYKADNWNDVEKLRIGAPPTPTKAPEAKWKKRSRPWNGRPVQLGKRGASASA